jgi:hypothetical protein
LETIAESIDRSQTYGYHRAFLAAEIAMASVNCGAANVTRVQAEKLLDDYFARVEQAIAWTEINPLDRRS